MSGFKTFKQKHNALPLVLPLAQPSRLKTWTGSYVLNGSNQVSKNEFQLTWRNAKKLQGHVTTIVFMHRWTITTVYWHCRMHNSAWKAQFSISVWMTAVRVQMWRQSAKCSIFSPQRRGKRGHRSCCALTVERPEMPSMPIVAVVESRRQTHGSTCIESIIIFCFGITNKIFIIHN